MDGGAWWAAVRGVAKSRTRLSDFTFTFLCGASTSSLKVEVRPRGSLPSLAFILLLKCGSNMVIFWELLWNSLRKGGKEDKEHCFREFLSSVIQIDYAVARRQMTPISIVLWISDLPLDILTCWGILFSPLLPDRCCTGRGGRHCAGGWPFQLHQWTPGHFWMQRQL